MRKLKHFGEKIRALRIERDITIQQMHTVTGFARSTIRQWETNRAYPSSHQVILILADFFQVSPSYFYAENDSVVDPVLNDIIRRVQRLESELKAIHTANKEDLKCQSTPVSEKT